MFGIDLLAFAIFFNHFYQILRSRPDVVDHINGFDLGVDESVSFDPNDHRDLRHVNSAKVQDGRFVRPEGWVKWTQ